MRVLVAEQDDGRVDARMWSVTETAKLADRIATALHRACERGKAAESGQVAPWTRPTLPKHCPVQWKGRGAQTPGSKAPWGIALPRMHPQDTERARTARVLVMDDDVALTSVLAKAFASERLQVDIAYDGAQGLARALNPPSVVVMDLHMPVIDGYAFIDAFRAMPGCLEVPIIVATGVGEVATARRRLEGQGIVLIAPKPFDLETLIAGVLGLVRSHGLRARDIAIEGGSQVMLHMQSGRVARQLRVLVVEQDASIAMGVRRFIPKPFLMDELVGALAEIPA